MGASGCAFFLPKHARSLDLRGERVVIRLLTADDWQSEAVLAGIPHAAAAEVGCETALARQQRRERMAIPGAAEAAGLLAGVVVDFVKTQLEEEATRYEAQYVRRVAVDRFWRATRNAAGEHCWTQNYVGFDVRRITQAHGQSSDSAPAFRMIFGFEPSADQQVLLVKPVFARLEASKAKVLDVRAWSPPSWLLPLFKSTGNEVEVQVDVQLDAIWIDASQRAKIEQLAAFTVNLGNYDLDARPQLTGELADQQAGWLPAVPISTRKLGRAPSYAGTFWVKVAVTERDPGNAKKWLERAAREVGARKEAIVERVESEVGGGE